MTTVFKFQMDDWMDDRAEPPYSMSGWVGVLQRAVEVHSAGYSENRAMIGFCKYSCAMAKGSFDCDCHGFKI